MEKYNQAMRDLKHWAFELMAGITFGVMASPIVSRWLLILMFGVLVVITVLNITKVCIYWKIKDG